VASSSEALTAVLHQTIEAGVGIVGYRFAAKDSSSASPEDVSSVVDECGTAVVATASEGLLTCQLKCSMFEWEDVDESISTHSPFALSQQFLLQWEPDELRNLNVTFQKILLDNVLGRLRGMVKREILKVND